MTNQLVLISVQHTAPQAIRDPNILQDRTEHQTLDPNPVTPNANSLVLHVGSEQLWEDAVERFRKEGTNTLPESVAKASLEDCLASFQATMDLFEREHSAKEKIRSRVQAILKAIESFSGFVGEGVSAVSTIRVLALSDVNVD